MGFNVFSSGFPLTGVPTGAVWGVDITGGVPFGLVEIDQVSDIYGVINLQLGALDYQGNGSYRWVLGQNSLGHWHSKWLVNKQLEGEYDFWGMQGSYTGPTLALAQAARSSFYGPSAPTAAPGSSSAAAGSSQASQAAIPSAATMVSPILTPQFQRRFVGAAGGAVVLAAGGPIGIAVAVASVIGGILGGLFGGLFGGTDLGKQIDQLKQVMVDIGNALAGAITAVMHALGKVLKFLKGIWEDVLHGLIDQLKKVITQLGHLFRDILPKIADWVRKIRQRILNFYEHFVRPLILILQRVHTILRILAAFHIKWAARLDAKLQNLEARILAPMFWLLTQINGIVNVFNWILDLKMLIQRTLMINSLFATAGTWTKIFWNVQTGTRTFADVQAAADANGVPGPSQTQADAQQFRDTGGGPLADLAGVGQAQAIQIFGGGA